MENRDIGLERLCKIYLDLTDEDRGKIIRLGEGLLNSQKEIDNKRIVSTDKTDNSELKMG